MLTPKNLPQNRIKTKSLYDPVTHSLKRKEDEIKEYEEIDNLRGSAHKIISKNQRSKSSSSFDELEDNVDEFH